MVAALPPSMGSSRTGGRAHVVRICLCFFHCLFLSLLRKWARQERFSCKHIYYNGYSSFHRIGHLKHQKWCCCWQNCNRTGQWCRGWISVLFWNELHHGRHSDRWNSRKLSSGNYWKTLFEIDIWPCFSESENPWGIVPSGVLFNLIQIHTAVVFTRGLHPS